MNKKKTYLFMAIMFFVLAGCQNQTTNNPQIQPTNSQQAALQTQQAFLLADRANYDAAFSLKDISYCEKIQLATTKELCKTELNDSFQLEKAFTQKDQALCEKLSNEDKKQACKTRIEVMMKESQTQQQQQDQFQQDQKNMAALIEKKDYTSCKTLQLSSSQYDCELNILSNLALQQKDLKVCDKASSKEILSACQELFNKAQAN